MGLCRSARAIAPCWKRAPVEAQLR